MEARTPRYDTNEKASVEIYGKNGTTVASLKNLSRGGACIEWVQTDFPLEKGDLIRLSVKLESIRKSHNVSAEVVWKEGNRSGLTFLTSDQVFLKMLEKA